MSLLKSYRSIGSLLAEAFTQIGKGKFGMVSTPKKGGGKASVYRVPKEGGKEKVLTTSGKEVTTSKERADKWEAAAKKREGQTN